MLLSATTSRKKQQAELVQSVIHAEEEKRRKERQNFHITSVPVLTRASYEPSLYVGASEEHGGTGGDESECPKERGRGKEVSGNLFTEMLHTSS